MVVYSKNTKFVKLSDYTISILSHTHIYIDIRFYLYNMQHCIICRKSLIYNITIRDWILITFVVAKYGRVGRCVLKRFITYIIKN